MPSGGFGVLLGWLSLLLDCTMHDLMTCMLVAWIVLFFLLSMWLLLRWYMLLVRTRCSVYVGPRSFAIAVPTCLAVL